MEDEESDGEFWITQSTCSKRSSELNVVIEKEIGDVATRLLRNRMRFRRHCRG